MTHIDMGYIKYQKYVFGLKSSNFGANGAGAILYYYTSECVLSPQEVPQSQLIFHPLVTIQLTIHLTNRLLEPLLPTAFACHFQVQ